MRLLCLQCAAETEADPESELSGCPSCGDSAHVPANLDDTVNITITRHELRILTIWANNWAHSHDDEPGQKAVRTILDRLGTQTDTPLTLGQEIADLRAAFGDVRVISSGGEEVDLP